MTDIDGNREFMEAVGAEKFLFKPRDAGDAAGKIAEIIKTGGRAYKASSARILKEFGLKFMLKAHEKIYLKP